MEKIAEVCLKCGRLEKPDTQAGIFIQWFGNCLQCEPVGDNIRLRDDIFDCELEELKRRELAANTGVDRDKECYKASPTHEHFEQHQARVWDQGVDKVVNWKENPFV